jgi:hypothetical protein
MIWEVMEEARQIMREMPGFTAAFVVLLALCIGVRCAIFYEADGEHLKVTADRHNHPAEWEERTLTSASDAFTRMRAHTACPLKTPGFTLIVGLRQFDMEVSVPLTGVRALFEDAHMDVVALFTHRSRITA